MATARRPARTGEAPEAPEAPGDELFECPPSQFVESRKAVVRRLRADGDRDGAAQVAAMRRPTVSVWALNQVARHDPALIAALRTASAQLHAATEKALAGDASVLRPAQDAERVAVDDVVAAAGDHLATIDEPATGTTTQRMLDTLRATGTDERAASVLTVGRLTEDLTWAGLGLDGFQGTASPAGRPDRTPRKRAAAGRSASSDVAATKRAERDRTRWAKLDEAARQAEAQAQALATEADEAGRASARAAAAAAKARQAADQAQARATRARARAAPDCA